MNDLKKKLVSDPRYTEALSKVAQKPAILLAPTGHCNFACTYCSTSLQPKKPYFADLEFIKNVSKNALQLGWPLSFGQTYEPFLHPQIDEIIQYVDELGGLYYSPTNAAALPRKVWDLPMSLMISYSANAHDFVYRGTAISFEKYHTRLLDFIRHRIAHSVRGAMCFQIADYSILSSNTLEYDKRIVEAEAIYEKSIALGRALGTLPEHDRDEWIDRITQRAPLVLHAQGPISIEVHPTKIVQNSFETFMAEGFTNAGGYCDSCYTMMSIQADQSVAYCCCDPTAKAIAGKLGMDGDIKSFWNGPEMQAVRDAFQRFSPQADFCHHCLAPVSERIKPLLTVQDPHTTATILRDLGVSNDQPWFTFPK